MLVLRVMAFEAATLTLTRGADCSILSSGDSQSVLSKWRCDQLCQLNSRRPVLVRAGQLYHGGGVFARGQSIRHS